MSVVPYPLTLDLEGPDEVARWRPLLNWVLAIPHYVVLYFLRLIAGVLTFVALLTVLFTRRIPDSVFDFIATCYRYQWRVTSFAAGLREEYPPFEFITSAEDTETDPATLGIERPEELHRLLPLVKWLLAFPHYLALMFLGIAAVVAWLVGALAVLFGGEWPHGIREFLVGVSRWSTRVQAYVGLLTDDYPPFSLS